MADLLGGRFPGDEVRSFSVGRMDVRPCVGCNRCADGGGCFMHDDMDGVLDALAGSSELYVVSPVYFAGPPAQLKALLDRMQPLFFADARLSPKRPAYLLIVGGGGDPHGFAPLETIARSALAVAGFRLDAVEPSIGENLAGVLAHADHLAGGE
jgi:multimeric flavodoxin WrbA